MKRKSSAPRTIDLARNGIARLVTAGVLAFAASLPAQASIIKFDDPAIAGLIGDSTSLYESGYQLTTYSVVAGANPGADLVGAVGDKSFCENLSCPASDSPYFISVDDALLDILPQDPNAKFRLNGFDASFVGADATPAVPGLLRAQGFFSDGTYLTETYRLDGITAQGNYNFAHFNASAAFSSQVFNEIFFFGYACDVAGSCQAFETDRGQFAIDNIDLVDIPEPSVLFLVALGLLGMGLAVRNRRSV